MSLPARLHEFVGEWLPLPQKDIFRLGVDPSSGTLGKSIILGEEVWSSQHKFRVALGPLGYDDYLSFLPGEKRTRQLVDLVRNYVGDEPAWDLMLILKWQEVPLFCLDGQYRLGWTAWLGKRPGEDDADDLALRMSTNVNLKN